MKLCFDSIEEVKEFVASLKGTRGKKGDNDEGTTTGATGGAPQPAMPLAGGTGGPQFSPPPAAFNPQPGPQGGFPGAPQGDPASAALVVRIVAKIDGAISGGQPADAVLNWFRGQCGNEAANATLDQIKQSFLPKLPMPTLEQIAKLMNA